MIETITLKEAILSTAEIGNITKFLGTNGNALRIGTLGLQSGSISPGESVILDARRYKLYHFVEYSTAGISAVIVTSYKFVAIVGGYANNLSNTDEEDKVCLIAGEDTITVKNNRSRTIDYQLFNLI